ncbi:MAG TPA: hypothetical protein VKU00_02650, partial [Chthonomonadaceae bacterium]|nr:hypothetical protein [Chthonomonadaceae bacterium]
MLSNRLAFVVSLLALQLQVAAGAQQTYLLTDIGPSTVTVGTHMQLAINASGQIVGTSEQANGADMAWVWTPSSANASTGTFASLPVPSGTHQSEAEGINSSGQIVGSREYPSGTTKVKGKTIVVYTWVGVEWQSNGSEVDLPAGFGTVANAINDSGEMVGGTTLLVNGNIYSLPGGSAVSINKSGQVAGWLDGTGTTGYLWTPSSPNGTSGSYVTFSFDASQVNDLGQVVGGPYYQSVIADLFSISTGVQVLLSPPPNSGATSANSINNLGQVVGFTQ